MFADWLRSYPNPRAFVTAFAPATTRTHNHARHPGDPGGPATARHRRLAALRLPRVERARPPGAANPRRRHAHPPLVLLRPGPRRAAETAPPHRTPRPRPSARRGAALLEMAAIRGRRCRPGPRREDGRDGVRPAERQPVRV